MITLCLKEADIPETVAYAGETEKLGGMVAGHKHAMINYLQRRYNYRLADFAEKNDFLVIGAYIEQCVGWLALDLLEKYDAKSVTIDMQKSFSLLEKYKFLHARTILTPNKREELLWENHPELHPFSDRLNLD